MVKDTYEGLNLQSFQKEFYDTSKYEIETILYNERNLQLKPLIYYSILFEIDGFTYSTFINMSDKEKKNLFTDNTHENKLYIKDLLIQKYEGLCDTSLQECLQTINIKYSDITIKDIPLLQQSLFRKYGVLLYLYSINNSMNNYFTFIHFEEIMDDINTLDTFVNEYNEYITKFNKEYQLSNDKNKEQFSFLKENIDKKNMNHFLDNFICKKYKENNYIYSKINNNIYKRCNKNDICLDSYDLDITKHYLCPKLNYNNNNNPIFINGNTYNDCCKSSFITPMHQLLKKYKIMILLIIIIIVYLKN